MSEIILNNEEMVGKDHVSKSDTLSRALLIEHNDGGVHFYSYASLYEDTPAGTINIITTGGTYVKWTNSTAGPVAGGTLITSSISTDDITIGNDGAGVYDAYLSASVSGQSGMKASLAIFVDGVRQGHLTRTVELGGSHKHFPDSIDVKIGTINSGDVNSLMSKDATYLDIQESATPTGHIVDMLFVDVVAPVSIDFAGRYEGTAGHNVEIQVFDADRGLDRVQHGGTAYNCIRAHTAGADTDEPGVEANWTSYWEDDGAAVSEPAWVDTTVYDDGFDEVRVTSKDLPHNTVDYTRSWIVGGSHIDRTKYSDANGNCHIRSIHKSAGTGSHQVLFDAFSLQDDHSGTSITISDLLPVIATDVVDARLTTNEDSSQLIVTSLNFKLTRGKIS